MEHEQIIQTLEKLIPVCAEQGPEKTLIKYANDNNLSPAQLERLAQMYNTALTINFMNKSSKDRGQSFDLVSTDKMLGDFTAVDNTTKSADVDPWFEGLDVVKSASTTSSHTFDSMPDLLSMAKLGSSEFIKEPELTFEETPGYEYRVDPAVYAAAREKVAFTFELDGVDRMIFESEEDFRKIAAKVEDLILINGLTYDEVIGDGVAILGEPGVKAANQLSRYLEQRHVPAKLSVRTKKASVLADKYDGTSILLGLKEAVDTIEAARAYTNHIKSAVKYEDVDVDTDEYEFEDEDPQRPDKKLRLKKKKKDNSNDSKDKDSGGNKIKHTAYPSLMQAIDDEKKQGPRQPMVDPQFGEKMMALLNPGEYFGQVAKLKEFGEKILPDKGFNSSQQKVDTAVSDVEAITTLQRLVLTDPIISEADPETVVSLYNTIRAADPNIAADANILRFALREALQYEAIPSHTYKDLVDTNRKKVQTTKDEKDLTSRNYAV